MKSSTATGLGKFKTSALKYLGWFFAFDGVCLLINSIANCGSSGDEALCNGFLIGGIFALGIGVACLLSHRRSSRLLADFRKYNAILASDPVKTIYRIAEMTGETAETVRIKVNRMIEKNYFVNAYIDQSSKIVLADRDQMNQVVGNNDGRKDFVTIACPSCGGVNRLVKGQVCKCEFCGAYISDKT